MGSQSTQERYTLAFAEWRAPASTNRINNSAGITLKGGGTFKSGGLSEGARPSGPGSNGTEAAGIGALTLQTPPRWDHTRRWISQPAPMAVRSIFSSLVGGSGAFLDVKNWSGLAGMDPRDNRR